METLKVLVADDEPGMRLGVERTLSRCCFPLPDFHEEVGFRVDKAGSGREALDLIETEPPDILVLDYKLPDIQGLDILQDITRRKLDILTVMITAYASLDVAISATRIGAFDFLAKPFTPDELENVLRKAAKHIYTHRKARKLQEERRQVRFQFISVLAHELKSPLSAVEGYLRILEKKMLGDAVEKYDTMIERSLTRLDGMRKMIFDLLDLTRIESGQKNRRLTSVDLVETARQSVEGVLAGAAERQIEVRLQADAPVRITADRGEIEIILNNLLTNAVKYNRDNGRVDLAIAAADGTAVITCTDTGVGMSPEETERLFGEFVRIKNEKTRHIVGSGLGLSIVKKLLNFYDGTIRVTSEPDRGSTFSVRLKDIPLAPVKKSAAQELET